MVFPRPLPAALALAALLPAAVSPLTALPSIPGVLIGNPEWGIIMTPEGYSDVALDQRPGFVGREYLSGEWAAAIHYTGGSNPAGPIWFRSVWGFPCWTSNSNFSVVEAIVNLGPNGGSFDRYRSIITNGDVEITMHYEMIDTVGGIEQGLSPASAGSGSSLTSSRYVLRHSYSVKNVSGGPLGNVRFFQFLHGLNSGTSVWDDRVYPGAMSDYRYDNTQQGASRSINNDTGEIFDHFDTVCMHAMQMPSDYECGYYGIEGIDDHEEGKPSEGTHLSVEADNLDETDSFDPPEGRWVSGAMAFDFPALAADSSHEMDVLLSIRSDSGGTGEFPAVEVVDAKLDGAQFLIDFRDANQTSIDGFLLYMSEDLSGSFPDGWTFVSLPAQVNVPEPGLFRFAVPVDTANDPDRFFVISPFIE